MNNKKGRRKSKEEQEGEMKKFAIAAAIGADGLLPALDARADSVEKPDVSIAVGGKVALYYLPLTIAESKGYFKAEGLNARVLDFQEIGRASCRERVCQYV